MPIDFTPQAKAIAVLAVGVADLKGWSRLEFAEALMDSLATTIKTLEPFKALAREGLSNGN